jgi:TPR repeat protein
MLSTHVSRRLALVPFLSERLSATGLMGGSFLFSRPAPGVSFGSRHSPFLQIDRLSVLQRTVDTSVCGSAFLDRLGQRLLLGPRPDLPTAAHFFSLSAAAGNADAQCTLGLLHHAGLGVDQNSRVGTDYLRRAAAQGHARAKYCYGICLRAGVGIRPDIREGMVQLRAAAEEGYDEAIFAYGCSLLGGVGVDRDEKTAFSLFQKAAQKGHTLSILWQGVCLHDGIGVEKDRTQAVSLFREASSKGLREATEVLKKATWTNPGEFQGTPMRGEDGGK